MAGITHLGATLAVHAVISVNSKHAEGASSEVPRVRLAESAGTAQTDGTVAAKKVSVIKGSFAGGTSDLVAGAR